MRVGDIESQCYLAFFSVVASYSNLSTIFPGAKINIFLEISFINRYVFINFVA